MFKFPCLFLTKSIVEPTKALMKNICSLLVIFLALVASSSPSFSTPEHYLGERTTLVIDAIFIPRHDSDDWGHTTISLLSKNKTVCFKRKLNDNYSCLGYSRTRHAFILQTLGEAGASLGVDAFEYLPEEKPAIIYSKSYTHRYFADRNAIIPSPDLRFIAFVGRQIESSYNHDWHLYVLDTKLDTIRFLGKAPDPPPFSKEELEAAKARIIPKSSESPNTFWGWGLDSTGSKLESNICQFASPHVMKVSYGRDTFMHRSKNRLIRKWDL